ncbi:ABC transporter substrate-binding protein [Candidatus Bathyarchaeota archaeon]|nr:ABC transporter substrate-binding protein [Candidatus Bathyarchaeota archaeon]
MKNKVDNTRKLSAALIAVIIALASTGIWSYFAVYTPYYETERARLLTFTTDLIPNDLDPALAADTDSLSLVLNVFDRLVQYKKGSAEIEPSLATDWEMPDSKTYVFNLKKDVFFHDSTPFNATSVKFSLDRAKELGGALSYLFSVIDSTEVLDTYKVKITLNENFAPFLQILAHPAASIVSQAAVEKYGEAFDSNPVGTGPFKFDHWVSGKELVLTANKEYFKGAPKFEKIVFKVVLESSEREKELLIGNVDAVFGTIGVPVQDLPALERNPDVRVSKSDGSGVEFLGFNTQKPPLNEAKVREAIAYAIDYDAIIKDVMGGVAERIAGPVPPSIFGYADLPMTQRDVAKAKQLLVDAGYPDGFDITLTYNIDNIARRQAGEVIRDSLTDVGINVRLEGLDWESALDEYFSMQYEMCLNIWLPDYFDADGYLTPLFHSSSIANGFNIFGFSDPRVDELVDQARSATSPDVRLKAYQEAQQIIVSQVPAVFLYVPDIYDVTRFNVANWVQSPTGYFYAYDLYRQ